MKSISQVPSSSPPLIYCVGNEVISSDSEPEVQDDIPDSESVPRDTTHISTLFDSLSKPQEKRKIDYESVYKQSLEKTHLTFEFAGETFRSLLPLFYSSDCVVHIHLIFWISPLNRPLLNLSLHLSNHTNVSDAPNRVDSHSSPTSINSRIPSS